MSKLLSIESQKASLTAQLHILHRLKYKLSSQLRHHKQLHLLSTLLKKTNALLKIVDPLQEIPIKNIFLENVIGNVAHAVNVGKRIIRGVRVEGGWVKGMLERGYLLQFATVVFAGLAKIYDGVQRVVKKLEAIQKVQEEHNRKKNKDKQKNSTSQN